MEEHPPFTRLYESYLRARVFSREYYRQAAWRGLYEAKRKRAAGSALGVEIFLKAVKRWRSLARISPPADQMYPENFNLTQFRNLISDEREGLIYA